MNEIRSKFRIGDRVKIKGGQDVYEITNMERNVFGGTWTYWLTKDGKTIKKNEKELAFA